MRQSLKDQEVGLDPHFRYRGKNQTRVETFSDAAFALAITLIVLSSSVPHTYQDLWVSLSDIVPFGLCVILVMVIWYQHYIFFLRYGLQDITVIVLNTFLIFLILIYVYPLKFLCRILFDLHFSLITGDQKSINTLFSEVIQMEDTPHLMIIYGLGAALISFTFSLMYKHVIKNKEALNLSEYELLETKISLTRNILMAGIPMLSVLIAWTELFGWYTFLAAGFTYMLFPPIMFIHGIKSGRKKKKLISQMDL